MIFMMIEIGWLSTDAITKIYRVSGSPRICHKAQSDDFAMTHRLVCQRFSMHLGLLRISNHGFATVEAH